MKEMKLNKIKIDEKHNEQVIVLKEVGGDLLLPVVIGIPEVNAIKLKLSGVTPPRPLTHDLLNDTIRALNAELKMVVIDNINDRTFFAKLTLKKEDGSEVLVDARPSDSIALALRAGAPIYVEDVILEKAGIHP